MLTPDDLRDIVSVLDSTRLNELYVETADLAITLRRDEGGGAWTVSSRVTREPHRLETPDADGDRVAPGDSPEVQTGAAAVEAPSGDDVHRVTPPLLGTFYRAPKPGAPPFVEVGSTVRPDTVVGIVETMKMMSSIYAGAFGTVTEICLADAQFADTDTALMLIEVSP